MQFSIFPALFDRPTNMHFSDQEDDEHIELLLRRHWITNVPWIFFSILGFIGPLFFVDVNHNLQFGLLDQTPFQIRLAFFILWYLAVIAYIIENFLYWYFNIYIVTNKHIICIIFNSVLNRMVKESRLDDVQSVSTQVKGILRPVFNFGDVVIETAAKDVEIQFLAVPSPDFVAKRIEELQNSAESQPVVK